MGAGEEDHSSQLFMPQLSARPEVPREAGRAGVRALPTPGCVQLQCSARFGEQQSGRQLLWGRMGRAVLHCFAFMLPALLGWREHRQPQQYSSPRPGSQTDLLV